MSNTPNKEQLREVLLKIPGLTEGQKDAMGFILKKWPSLEQLEGEIEGMKKDTPSKDDTSIYPIAVNSYNKALSDVLALIKKHQ